MKVLDLHCTHQHVFEGWFASEDDFQGQLARGLVACPVCGDSAIAKKLSAPRLNLGAAAPQTQPGAPAKIAPQAPEQSTAISSPKPHSGEPPWLPLLRRAMAETEDVGDQFPELARKMHYGETEERAIRGQASVQEAVSLLEEGVEVLPLPMLRPPKEPVH